MTAKYLNKKKKRVFPGLIIGVMAVVILALGACVLLLAGEKDGGPKPQVQPVQTTAPVVIPAAVVDDAGWEESDDPELVLIHTPYAALTYSAQWKDYLVVRQAAGDVHSVVFCAAIEGKELLPLFELQFGRAVSGTVGVFRTEKGFLSSVGMQVYPFNPDESWSEAESNVVYSMQEAVNDVVGQLNMEEGAVASEVYEIETPYGVLRYPADRAAYLNVVQTEGTPYTVEFYGEGMGLEPVLLFTLTFGEGEDPAVGTVTDSEGNTLDLRLGMEELVFDSSVDQSIQNMLFTMQENVNILLESLLEE